MAEEEDDAIHRELSDWIVRNGGTVHSNLTLRTPSTPRAAVETTTSVVDDDGHPRRHHPRDDDDYDGDDRRRRRDRFSRRGIFAERGPISKGEVLVCLPRRLALDGRTLPSVYHPHPRDDGCHPPPTDGGGSSDPTEGGGDDCTVDNRQDDFDPSSSSSRCRRRSEETRRHASPWLRCLASLVIARRGRRRTAEPRLRRRGDGVGGHGDGGGGGGEMRDDAGGDDDDGKAAPPTEDDSSPSSSMSFRDNYDPYLSSLPDEYDSLLNWSGGEVRCFLAGTSLGAMMMTTTTSTSSSSSSKEEDAGGGTPMTMVMRERFLGTVAPYLSFLRDEGLLAVEDEGGYDDISPPPRGGGDDDLHRKRLRTEEATRSSPANGTDDKHAIAERRRGDDADHLYPIFLEGCMCISTRAFHMQSAPPEEAAEDDHRGCVDDRRRDETYHGPYLLPYVDLLNHSPRGSPGRVTTLRRDADGSFFMVAERDIAAGEEIRHSYDPSGTTATTADEYDDDDDDDDGAEGSDRGASSARDGRTSSTNCGASSGTLNSAQLLRTFGFVDVGGSARILSDYYRGTVGEIVVRGDDDDDVALPPPTTILENATPAVLSKKELCRCCELLANSSYPLELRGFMDESGLSDEGWESWHMPSSEEMRSRGDSLLTSFSDEIVVPFDGTLSDELISVCCLHFLPQNAIDELLGEESTIDDDRGGGKNRPRNLMFGNEALEDYFLGKLVLRAIVNALDLKLNSYKVSSSDILSGFVQHEQARKFLDLLGGLYLAGYQKGVSFIWGESGIGDAIVLLKLKPSNDGRLTDLVQKFSCGMVISLEERACLLELKKKVFEMVDHLINPL